MILEIFFICLCLDAMICRQNLVKSHVYGITFSFTQSLIFFAYAAIFTFGAFLIKKGLVSYEDMFKYVATAIADFFYESVSSLS